MTQPSSEHGGPRTSGLAIASLVTGLLGCLSIAGLVLGIVALVQIRHTGERGRGLAIGGIAAFAVWLALFATALATGVLTFWGAPAERDSEGVPRPVSRSIPKEGQCLDSRGGEPLHNSVTIRCDAPHDLQIVHTFEGPPSSDPEDPAFEQQAKSECQRAKVKLRLPLPPPPPAVTLGMAFAKEPNRAAGGQLVVCYVLAKQGKLTGSLLKG